MYYLDKTPKNDSKIVLFLQHISEQKIWNIVTYAERDFILGIEVKAKNYM